MCVRKEYERVRDFVGDEESEKKKNKKKVEAKEEIPVPAKWESNTFSAVLRFRSAPDPFPPVPICSPSRLILPPVLLPRPSR